MSGIVLISVAIIVLGTAILWLGTIFQMSENPAMANDAKVWLGVGMGMVLAGCGFGFVTGLLYPDVALEARRQAAMTQMALDHAATKVAAVHH